MAERRDGPRRRPPVVWPADQGTEAVIVQDTPDRWAFLRQPVVRIGLLGTGLVLGVLLAWWGVRATLEGSTIQPSSPPGEAEDGPSTPESTSAAVDVTSEDALDDWQERMRWDELTKTWVASEDESSDAPAASSPYYAPGESHFGRTGSPPSISRTSPADVEAGVD